MRSLDSLKLRLYLAGLSWEVGQDPRGDLICELLRDAVRLIGEFVVPALNRQSEKA
jgi:hypothetical protein